VGSAGKPGSNAVGLGDGELVVNKLCLPVGAAVGSDVRGRLAGLDDGNKFGLIDGGGVGKVEGVRTGALV
jgi:hypothetical protein